MHVRYPSRRQSQLRWTPQVESVRACGSSRCGRGLRQRTRQLLLLLLCADAHHVPGEAQPLQRGYDQTGDVDFPPTQSMEGRRGEGVMVVVPRLAERGHCQPEHIRGVILQREASFAVEVANRVDAPRDVVQEEDPYESTPEHR